MLLLLTVKPPEGKDWLYELKFDGYRALAIESGGRVQLRSRNDNDFAGRYSSIAGFTVWGSEPGISAKLELV